MMALIAYFFHLLPVIAAVALESHKSHQVIPAQRISNDHMKKETEIQSDIVIEKIEIVIRSIRTYNIHICHIIS